MQSSMEQVDFTYDVIRDCKALSGNKTFKTLYELICSHGKIPAAQWIENGEIRSWTYDEQAQFADNYAAAISSQIGTSGRVCISLDSCKEWFPLFWGLLRSGHDILAVDAMADDKKLSTLMREAGCDILISATHRNIQCSQISIKTLIDSPVAENYKPVWGHNIALCTSGTTSDSRIFVYNEATICEIALFSEGVYKKNHLCIDDKGYNTLAFLPFHHILGLSAIFIWSSFTGFTLVYIKDRTPKTITETCQRCHINQIVTIPLLANNLSKGLLAEVGKRGKTAKAMFSLMEWTSLATQRIFPKAGLALAKKMFSKVRKNLLGDDITCIILGGSSTDSRSLRHLNAIGYYTICGFGMTETSINSFEMGLGLRNRLNGSIGEPLLNTEYRIKEGKDTGELQVRGKGIHDGRIVDGKILPADVDADGWFSTGDIISINKSKDEYLIRGRIKDVIINESGENVYPDELETIFSNLSNIDQYAILGVRKKNSIYEDITLALNVGNRIADDDFIHNLESQIAGINRSLPVYKRVSRVVASSSKFPTTTTLKIKRSDLSKSIAANTIPLRELNLSAATSSSNKADVTVIQQKASDVIVKQMTEIFASNIDIPISEINPDVNIIESLGIDSLQVLSIVTEIEEKFGVIIPTESYASSCTSITEASLLVEKLIAGNSCSTSEAQTLTERKAVCKFEDSEEYICFKARMDGMLASGQKNPYFVCHESPLLDTSVVNGRKLLDFGSYNYVGMSGRKEVSDAAKEAIDKYGTSASGSRLLAGEKPIHSELEQEIASWKNAEKALVCVSGHATNLNIVGSFCGKKDLILYDAIAHNSITQGCQLSEAMAKPFPHNDPEALERILKTQRHYFEKVLIVIEGVYSMDGDIAPVPEFIEIKKKYNCFLMVDEAHSDCVLGTTGGGIDEYFSLAPDDIDIKMGTLSKGLGACGGYLAGKASLIDYLRYNLPGFVFSVGISPALAAAALASIRLLRTHPEIMESLHRNIKTFADEAKKRNLNICLSGKSAVLPVLVGRDEDAFALSNELENRGILVPPAVYPAVPKNKARLRFDVISEHKPEQIIYTLDTLVQAAKDLGIELPVEKIQ